MNSFCSWLNKNNYELQMDSLYNNRFMKVKYIRDNSIYLLKMMSVSELDTKTVVNVFNTINKVNNMNIDGLMKYNIVEINENILYRIMKEYTTHLDIINPLKYFEETGIFEVLNRILKVLKYLNENKTIHSNLKPSNIFLNDENEVIINDYCSNLLYKGREGIISRKGNDVCFVSIDELLGRDLDISSDIWNFGLIFYYIKSGKYPFLGSNMLETMKNIENVKYIPLECECKNELNYFLKKILQKEKKDRLKLNEVISELKKLNEPHLKVVLSEEEEIKIPIELKNNIDFRFDKYIKENANGWNLSHLEMKDEGMRYFCSRLENMIQVVKIDLCVNNITSVGLNEFAECLQFFPNLSVLYISGNQLGSSDEKKKSYLEKLFSKKSISNYGLKLFSDNLYHLPKLTQLGFGDSQLIDNDVEYLSSNFKYIPNLIWIALSTNNIGDKGVKCFCDNISYIQNLEILYFHRNEISDSGGEMLLNNIHKLPKLKIFTSCNNKISNYKNFVVKIRNNHPNKEMKIDY